MACVLLRTNYEAFATFTHNLMARGGDSMLLIVIFVKVPRPCSAIKILDLNAQLVLLIRAIHPV